MITVISKYHEQYLDPEGIQISKTMITWKHYFAKDFPEPVLLRNNFLIDQKYLPMFGLEGKRLLWVRFLTHEEQKQTEMRGGIDLIMNQIEREVNKPVLANPPFPPTTN